MLKYLINKFMPQNQAFQDNFNINNQPNILIPSGGSPFRTTKTLDTPEAQLSEYSNWVFICSNLIANSIAASPLRVYAKINGKKLKNYDYKCISKQNDNYLKKMNGSLRRVDEIVELFNHPLSDLLSYVNNSLTSFDLFYLTQSHLDLCGFSLWYLQKNGDTVETIHPLNPKYIRAVLKNENEVDYYVYRINNKDIKIYTDDIVLFKNPNPACIWDGKSIVQAGSTPILRQGNYNEYDDALIKNNARADFLIKYDGQLSKEQMRSLTQEWNQSLTGNKNRGKVKIMDSKFSIEKLSFTPQDIEFQNGRLMTNKEICHMFSVPYSLIDSSNQLKAGLDSAIEQFQRFCLLPRLKRIEESINEWLVPEFDDSGNLFVAYDNPVEFDAEQTTKRTLELLNAGIIDVNEARSELGREVKDLKEEENEE
jgi:HK97 family phage portal protein